MCNKTWRLIPILIFVLATGLHLQSQKLSGMATQFNDSFVAWDIYARYPMDGDSLETETEEVKIGAVQQRWLGVREDWTEWDFTLDERQGTIRQKWKNDASEWELRTFDGDIISIKTIWRNDYTQWRVTDNTISLDLKSRYTSDFGEWRVRDNKHGDFTVKVLYANDPRDWTTEDELDEEVKETMKLAMIFIVAYMSSPRE